MNFDLDEQQRQMQDSLARLLAAELPLRRLQSLVADGAQPPAALHDAVAGMGCYGLLVPAAYGGVGLGLLDAALAAEAFGRAAAPLPFIASAGIVAHALARFGSDAQRARWLPGIASGAVVAAAALSEWAAGQPGDVGGVQAQDGRLRGEASFVLDGGAAQLFLLADQRGGLHLAEPGQAGVHHAPLQTFDRTRSVGTLTLDGCAAEPLGDAVGREALGTLLGVGRLLLAADMLGAASAMLDAATQYAQVRTQFGQPIGGFQAVKHLCADMAAQLVPCRAYVWGTAHAFDRNPAQGVAACAQLKAHLSEVGQFVARGAIEVHGGMGFTELAGLHLWFKRIGLSRQLLGGPTRLRAEAADALFGTPA
ncbi:acyl-CoA dehydrogenase family protein [Pseudorhodoferax sp.]|uniref:acyl-CoA dehydrogenase family protein n=1 Tax=Pseudorhodoferax sp. TaxID=1993553 RepID=UPI002DD63E36|nr:acyl-CoA dehydrogenase family protein [Pseudorhodoferax sp.]